MTLEAETFGLGTEASVLTEAAREALKAFGGQLQSSSNRRHVEQMGFRSSH